MKIFANIGQWGNPKQAIVCFGHHNYDPIWRGISINLTSKLTLVLNLRGAKDFPRAYFTHR